VREGVGKIGADGALSGRVARGIRVGGFGAEEAAQNRVNRERAADASEFGGGEEARFQIARRLGGKL
jgi:hypothetical protein